VLSAIYKHSHYTRGFISGFVIVLLHSAMYGNSAYTATKTRSSAVAEKPREARHS